MHQLFPTLDALFTELRSDKECSAVSASTRDRYPLRFVLFETFADFYSFTDECQERGVLPIHLEQFLPGKATDLLPTASRLERDITEMIRKKPAHDYYVAPFSELARFYDNVRYHEFDTLIADLRLFEASAEAQQQRQRIYIPIIGMEGKMSRWVADVNTRLWEYRSAEHGRNYRLVLTPGTLWGMTGLERVATVCRDVREWTLLWRRPADVRQTIVCLSRAIYDSSVNAQPDNAFDYAVCSTPYELLTIGLGLDFGTLRPTTGDTAQWARLCSEVVPGDFSWEAYVAERFNVQGLGDARQIAEAWLAYSGDYARWLLRAYYIYKVGETTYMGRALARCPSLSTTELFSTLTTLIYSEAVTDAALRERRMALRVAARAGVTITEAAERQQLARLTAMAASPAGGARSALPYVVGICPGERRLLVKWLGKGLVTRDDVRLVYPDLHAYCGAASLPGEPWLEEYFTEYTRSRLANAATPRLTTLLSEHNSSPAAFERWHAALPTVRTLLAGRQDIDIVYWVDGLSVEWLPLVREIISEHRADRVFLNELYIATALLPTRTAENRAALETLSPVRIEKAGDIDAFAHSHKECPAALADEIALVRKAVEQVLAQYHGQKIALTADHGVTYLSQLSTGMGLASVTADHSGRCGTWPHGTPPADPRYLALDDGSTLCSLTHASLTAKTPAGQGAHGGATPEEVIVPVLIISPQETATSYAARLLTPTLRSSEPVARYELRGLTGTEQPWVEYNGARYTLRRLNATTYESEPLPLLETARRLTIGIGQFSQHDNIEVQTGIEEDDLFA